MVIVADFRCSVQDYVAHFARLVFPRPDACSCCGQFGSLVGHGSYVRKALDRPTPFKSASSAGPHDAPCGLLHAALDLLAWAKACWPDFAGYGLDLQETIGYVKHHIQVAGYRGGSLFTDDAVARIFEYTKGVPRRVNQLCTTALMAGLIEQKQVLDESTIRKAIADIDHD